MKGFLSFLKGTHTLTLGFLLLFLTPLGDNLPLCSRGSSRRLPASLGPRRHARTHPWGEAQRSEGATQESRQFPVQAPRSSLLRKIGAEGSLVQFGATMALGELRVAAESSREIQERRRAEWLCPI